MQVQLFEFADLRHRMPLLIAEPGGRDQQCQPEHAYRRAAQARAAPRAARHGEFGLRGARRRSRGQRRAARLLQPIDSARTKIGDTLVEVARNLPAEFGFAIVHNVIPFALRMSAKAWTAREQCVFTLPSEQPMAAAVSATSSSSQ